MTSASRLRSDVETLAGGIGERNIWQFAALQAAADYVDSEFAAAGHTPHRQTYEVSRVPVSNIEVVLPGDTRSDEAVVIGAHYDTVSGCPGANDNGTGVAAVLELARRFAGRPCARSVRFVAFVNEEPPFFQTPAMGSLVYARAARARGDRIVAMLSLETMGYYSDQRGSQEYPPPIAMLYPDVGDFIGFVSNLTSCRLLMKARRAFRRRTAFPVRAAAVPEAVAGVGWSDHWSFWQAGYPAMMVTDTAPFRYPHYHTPDDTPDKVNFEKLAELVDGLEAVVEALAR